MLEATMPDPLTTTPKATPAETGSKPAPGALAVVQAFVNTYDLEKDEDHFTDPPALRAWLVAHALMAADEEATAADLSCAREVREALRALLLANGGAALEPEALAALERAATRSPMVVRFETGGETRLEPVASGVDGALGRLFATVHQARIEGSWLRLKACRNDACRWAFYDHSKNRSGSWCTMAVCGSRLKVRAYRQRRAGG